VRAYLAITLVALAGCSTVRKDTPLIVIPPAPVQQTELHTVWENEVAQDLAILKAIRPSLSGPAPALNLYDSATQGLASISGEPTAKAIDTFRGYVDKPDEKVLSALRAEKVALDKKTDDLEAKVKAEEEARIKAEAAKDAADQATIQASIQARKAESVSKLTTVGAIAAGVGVLALLLGHLLGISKLTAGLVISAGIGIAVAAPWLIDLAEMKWVVISLLAFLGTDLVIFVAVKSWRYLKPNGQT
jgi:hypothetical protein